MALRGVKVLDLTRILAGPFASQMLGSFGAQVVKIEHPDGGDPTRSWGPPFTQEGRESAYFLSVNSNKLGITLDLKKPEDQSVVQRLAVGADVLVHNFLPPSMARLGLDYDSLRERNPSLIYCSITGYGSTGPKSSRPGYDLAAAAEGGLLSITGPRGGEPAKVGVAITDICTGLSAVGAISSALYARERCPERKGQLVEVSLLETQVACLANVASNWLIAGKDGSRLGTEHESIVPYQSFRARDGEVVLAANTNHQFKALCEALQLHELLADQRFSSNAQRVANREVLIGVLSTTLAARTVAELEDLLVGAGIVFAPIKKVSEVFKDEQVLHRGMVQELQHSRAGPIKVVGPHIKYSDTPAEMVKAPPALGEDNDQLERLLQEWETHEDAPGNS